MCFLKYFCIPVSLTGEQAAELSCSRRQALHLGTSLHDIIDSFLLFSEHGVSSEDPCTLRHTDPNLCTQYQRPQHTRTRILRDSEIRDCLLVIKIYINTLVSSFGLVTNPGDEIHVLHRPLYQQARNPLGLVDLNHFLLSNTSNKSRSSFFTLIIMKTQT